MKAKREELERALAGLFGPHHGEIAAYHLDHIAFLDRHIARLDLSAEACLDAMPASWGTDADGVPGPRPGTGGEAAVLAAADRLAEIPGMSRDLARNLIAETGLDMTRFPTPGHLVSWAGLVPEATQSGRRQGRGKKGHGDGYARNAVSQAASGAARTTTFLGERYSRLARRRGKSRALVAVARSILVITWHLLSDPAARFTDLGWDQLRQQDPVSPFAGGCWPGGAGRGCWPGVLAGGAGRVRQGGRDLV